MERNYAVASPGEQVLSPGEAWSCTSQHVGVYLGSHPLLRGFHPVIRADAEGITGEVEYARLTLRARETGEGWWEPHTPQHGREIAERLAHDLHRQWLSYLHWK